MDEVNKEFFNYYIEEHKLINKFDTYVETLLDIIEKRIFPEIAHDNIKKYLTKVIYEKLKIEYSEHRFLKDEYKTTTNNLW